MRFWKPRATEWHRWFAWYPVALDWDHYGGWVWLEVIERRYLTQIGPFILWQRRAVK